MKFNKLGLSVTVASIIAVAGFAQAATVDPADFDSIFTEGERVATVDGADVSGNATVGGNGDVGSSVIAAGDDTLLVGRVVNTGSDSFTVQSVTGFATITVLNYAESSRQGVSPFSATFEFVVDGSVVSSISLGGSTPTILSGVVGSQNLTGQDLGVNIVSTSGASDYDISINIAAVPLPAAGILLMGALGGMGALRRRKTA